jgi:uncharacterized membrane protein HdeD (DUF308 family)
MVDEQPRVAEALGEMMAHKAARYWWAALVSGIAWLLIAWVVLRMDLGSLAAVGLLIGVVFLVSALNEAAFAQAVTGGWKLVHYGVAVVFVLAALWAFVRPINTFFALASVLGLILMLEGAFEIARAIASREQNPYWWLGLITGVLFLLLAIWVSSSDREFNLGRRAALILFWVGFMALFRGISHIGLAFGVRRLMADLPSRSRTAAGNDAAPTIPAQDARIPEPPAAARSAEPPAAARSAGA